MTAATHASIIGALEPSFVAVGARLVLRQRVLGRTATLMVATLVGATLVVTANIGTDTAATVGGDALVVISVVCAATYILVSSQNAGTVQPIVATLTQHVWALAIVVPALGYSITSGGFGPIPHGTGWLYVVFSGLLSYLIPFVLYLTAVQTMPAAVAAQYLALIPLTGMIGAAAILGEPITIQSVVGGVIVVAALYALARSGTTDPVPPTTVTISAGPAERTRLPLTK
jgi:drug/metabolite transporter (DMT)-like permease